MEWLNKIPNWIRIPIKVLLPALTIFSGILLFSDDNVIEALYMSDFKEKNGSSLGLIFIITLSLEIVYAFYYLHDKYKVYNIPKKTAKQLLTGNDVEFWVLASLYNEPKKSALFPMNDGLIARLEGKRYIAKFTQPVDVTMKLNYYMQPFVEWAFDYIIKKYERQNNSLKSRIEKYKDNKKIIYLLWNAVQLKILKLNTY